MKKQAFTLIELLLALAISSFVLLAMMQGQRNIMRFLERSKERMLINRKVCLLFNQIERDFTATFLPQESQDQKQKNGAQKKENAAEGQESENNKQKSEKPRASNQEQNLETEQQPQSYFSAMIYEDFDKRIDGKAHQLLQRISFVTTQPLQFYGEKRVRRVRVGYELQLDKERKGAQSLTYNLMRKETEDLKNNEFKEDTSGTEKNAFSVRSHLVADKVKFLSIECVSGKDSYFSWGDKEATRQNLPDDIRLHIELWNEEYTQTYSFNAIVPVISFHVKKEKKEMKDGETKGPAQNAVPQVPDEQGQTKVMT